MSHETVFAQHLDRLGGAGGHHAAHDLSGLEHDGAAGRGNERRALGAAECIITDGVSAAQNRYNG